MIKKSSPITIICLKYSFFFKPILKEKIYFLYIQMGNYLLIEGIPTQKFEQKWGI